MSYSDIQKKYGYTRRFIARWWKRYQETGGVADAPRSGRPNTLTLTQKREVARSLKRKPTSSLRKVTKRMKTEHHVSVSKDTCEEDRQGAGDSVSKEEEEAPANCRSQGRATSLCSPPPPPWILGPSDVE